MAKQKSVVSVHLDIAAICWATRSIQTKDDWAEWGRSFVESLATRKPELNEFAATLMKDVEDFRAAEAERIRVLRENSKEPVQDVRVQSVQAAVQTDSKSDSQTVSKKEKKVNTGDRFAPPTLEQVAMYCAERKNSVNPQKFIAYYESNGWRVGKNPMKSWKAAIVSTWESNTFQTNSNNQTAPSVASQRKLG